MVTLGVHAPRGDKQVSLACSLGAISRVHAETEILHFTLVTTDTRAPAEYARFGSRDSQPTINARIDDYQLVIFVKMRSAPEL